MEERKTISAKAFCRHHHIELTFIHSLHDYGLLQLETTAEEDCLLPQDQLELLEKMVRLHYDLHINLEGIDAIHHLLQKVDSLQQEVQSLRNRLRVHEII